MVHVMVGFATNDGGPTLQLVDKIGVRLWTMLSNVVIMVVIVIVVSVLILTGRL